MYWLVKMPSHISFHWENQSIYINIFSYICRHQIKNLHVVKGTVLRICKFISMVQSTFLSLLYIKLNFSLNPISHKIHVYWCSTTKDEILGTCSWYRSFPPLIFLPYGRRQPLLKPWRAHTSSWHCNTTPYFEHPKHGISREILRFYPSPLAILWKHTRQSNYRAQQDRIHQMRSPLSYHLKINLCYYIIL